MLRITIVCAVCHKYTWDNNFSSNNIDLFSCEQCEILFYITVNVLNPISINLCGKRLILGHIYLPNKAFRPINHRLLGFDLQMYLIRCAEAKVHYRVHSYIGSRC